MQILNKNKPKYSLYLIFYFFMTLVYGEKSACFFKNV